MHRRELLRISGAALALAACGDSTPSRGDILLFTGTTGFRHTDAIAAATQVLPARLAEGGASTDIEDDPHTLEDLSGRRAVVFLYTSGDDLVTPRGRSALETFVAAGGGWAGVHSATDTEYAWPFYGELVVVHFQSHTPVTSGAVDVEDAAHPATAALPAHWVADDEWYTFDGNPRGDGVDVLLALDEASIGGGVPGTDHPIAWAHARLGGRAFYTALGHGGQRWDDPAFVEHVAGGILSVR